MRNAQSNVNFEPMQEVNGDEMEEMKKMKEDRLKTKYEEIYDACSINGEEESDMQRVLTLAQEKGSSIWLSTLPREDLGFSLNKQEFQDAIAMR